MIFKDRVRKEPHKRKITYADGHSEEVTIEEVDGNVTQNGTPLNATNMNKLIQDKVPDITEMNVNNIDKLLFAYGDNMISTPEAYGYVINLPHARVPEQYKQQLFFSSTSASMYIRQDYGGKFKEWQKVEVSTKIWEGELQSGESISLDLNGYKILRIFAKLLDGTSIFYLDLGEKSDSGDYTASGTLQASTKEELYSILVNVNTSKNKLSVQYSGYWDSNFKFQDRKNSSYIVYKIEGLT